MARVNEQKLKTKKNKGVQTTMEINLNDKISELDCLYATLVEEEVCTSLPAALEWLLRDGHPVFVKYGLEGGTLTGLTIDPDYVKDHQGFEAYRGTAEDIRKLTDALLQRQ